MTRRATLAIETVSAKTLVIAFDDDTLTSLSSAYFASSHLRCWQFDKVLTRLRRAWCDERHGLALKVTRQGAPTLVDFFHEVGHYAERMPTYREAMLVDRVSLVEAVREVASRLRTFVKEQTVVDAIGRLA